MCRGLAGTAEIWAGLYWRAAPRGRGLVKL